MKRQVKNKGRVLGIDPGSFKCGYGVIGEDGGYVASGTFVLSPRKPLFERLKELHDSVDDLIEEYNPDEAVVEKVFFAKNVRSALSLGHARGAVLIAIAGRRLKLVEYSPLEVKKAVAGYGRAEKSQVQAMVKRILNIKTELSPDGADALALAICHMNMSRFVLAARQA